MRKPAHKQLTLRAETLRVLVLKRDALAQVAGGEIVETERPACFMPPEKPLIA